MTQTELIARIAKTNEMTKQDAKDVVNMVVEELFNSLVSGETVKLNKLGTFTIAERAAREGRNPRTGEKLLIPATKYPKFKAGKALKDAVKEL